MPIIDIDRGTAVRVRERWDQRAAQLPAGWSLGFPPRPDPCAERFAAAVEGFRLARETSEHRTPAGARQLAYL